MKENTKTYIAPTFNLALKKVKSELGPNALIQSHETVNGQAHVVAILETAPINESSSQEFGKSLFEKSLFSNQNQNADSEFSSKFITTPNDKKQVTNRKKANATYKLAEDIEYIKTILQNNVVKLQTLSHPGNEAYLKKLRRKLRQKGFDKEVVEQILYGAFECQSFEKLIQVIMENMIHLIRCQKMDFCSQRKVKAFIGPSGGGKTSFITKLVLHLMENKIDSNIALIFVNHSNIKVMEEAKILGRVFNIPSYYVENIKELEAAYHQSYDRNNVFIEFPSLDHLNSGNNFFFEFMYKFANDIDNTLILPAIANSMYIQKFISSYSNIKFDGIALTKWDENQNCEAVLNASIYHQLPLRFISEGVDNSVPLILATKEYFISHLQNNYFSPKFKIHNDIAPFENNKVTI